MMTLKPISLFGSKSFQELFCYINRMSASYQVTTMPALAGELIMFYAILMKFYIAAPLTLT